MKKLLPYRVGKKVGVFYFDAKRNRNEIKTGRIIARRWNVSEISSMFEFTFYAKYAVRFENGEIEVCDHKDLWTKFIDKEEND